MLLTTVFFALAKLRGAQIPASVLPKPPANERVVARVNGQDILAKDVEGYLWDWRGNEVLGDVITYHLIQKEAEKLKVEIAPEALQKAYESQVQKMKANIAPGQDVDANLRQQGFPKSRLYLRVHADLLLDQIVLKRFTLDDYVRISTAAYQAKSESATDVAAAIKRAEAAYDRLQKGGDWNAEVKASDDDAALKEQKGLLGWRMLTAFPTGTQNELKAVAKGSYTKPVQAGGAIQIFRLEMRGKDAKGAELEELRSAYLSTARQQTIEQLRKDAKIERLFPEGGN